MYVRISWMAFRFLSPETLPNELYSAAKNAPVALCRELINDRLRHSWTRAARTLLVTWGVAAALMGTATLFGGSNRDSWSHTFMEVLTILGAILALSGALSVGSFIKYALDCRMFWRAICDAARTAESYSAFLECARARGLFPRDALRPSRPSRVCSSSAVMALMSAAAIFVGCAVTGRAALGATGAVLIGLPIFLLANFYANKYS